MAGKWKLHNVSIDFAVTVLGYQIELSIVPFRWAKPALRTGGDMSFMRDQWSFQLFAGPLHIWSMSGLKAALAAEFSVTQNPFHGGALTPRRTSVAAS